MRGAALLLVGATMLLPVSCARSSHTTTPAAERLQREDLIAVSHALQSANASVKAEVQSARAAWRIIANGLPARESAVAAARAPLAAAARSAAKLDVPALLAEAQSRSLTGPGAQIAGLFRTYVALSKRGWTLIGGAIEQIEHGSPATAGFARANVALYIESIYDGHFSLAQIGKKLLAGYRQLGGPAAFGAELTEGELHAITRSYSEATDRLHPHVGVRLGS